MSLGIICCQSLEQEIKAIIRGVPEVTHLEVMKWELHISQLADKFAEKGKDPMDLARRMLKDYTRGLFIDMAMGDPSDLIKKARMISEAFDFRLERTDGSLRLLEDTLKKALDSIKAKQVAFSGIAD